MSEDIETLLKHMPLKAAPASLDARVLALRPAAPAAPAGAAVPLRRYRRMLALGFAGGALAAAAALVLAWGLWPSGPAVSGPPTEGVAAVAEGGPGAGAANLPTKPLRLERNWSQVSYDGLVFPDARTPWRQFRQQQVEHVRWTDPQRGIEVESTVPHENVILVKAPVY